MGVIGLVEKNEDVYYNGVHIHRGSGHVGAGGWGVRARDQVVGTVGDSVLSLIYPPPLSSGIKYVSFRVLAAGVPATDEVIFSVWKKTDTGTSFIRVYAYTIDESVIQAQYGSGVTFANNTIYTIGLPVALHIPLEPGYSYYVAVYSSGCELDYDTDGSINGAYYVAADMSASDQYAVAAMTLSDRAVSFECFVEPDTWDALTDGGAISEENTDWHNALWCSSPGGEWANPVNIYGAGVSLSTANEDALYIDVGASAALPTGDPWDPSPGPQSSDVIGDVFPDYAAYGVRALTYIKVDADMGASGTEKIYIQVNDTDDDTQYPTTGWQTMYTMTGTNAVSVDVYIPVIARWVRFVKGGTDTNQCEIDDVEIHSIVYGVDDGDFPISMVNDRHHCWIENYPTSVRIFKSSVKNMAGAEGTPGLPFTNRENVD